MASNLIELYGTTYRVNLNRLGMILLDSVRENPPSFKINKDKVMNIKSIYNIPGINLTNPELITFSDWTGIITETGLYDWVCDCGGGVTPPPPQPRFTLFNLTEANNNFEVGCGLASGSTGHFHWNIVNSSQLTPNSSVISDSQTLGGSLPTNSVNSGSIILPSDVIMTGVGDTYTWHITANKTGGGTISSNFTAHWYGRVYWGSSTSTSIDESIIIGFSNNQISSTRAGDYHYPAENGYNYLVYPIELGKISSIINPANNLPIAMDPPGPPFEPYDILPITNPCGVSVMSYVYKTYNELNGDITFRVT